MRELCLALLALSLAACGSGAPDPPAASGRLWPDADKLFHADARWIGGDGAYSVDLGGGRVLWLFGDSFIANDPSNPERADSKMVRNSIAVQTGYDPSNAFMQFYWPEQAGEPQSFLGETPGHWYWPMHGIRIDDTLMLFYEQLNTPAGDPSGFETDAWTAAVVGEPDASPSAWRIEPATLPATSHGVTLGEAVVRRGEVVYIYGTAGFTHAIYVARTSADDVRAGRLDALEWWTGDGWSGAADASPDAIVSVGAPELSVHYDPRFDEYVMVHSEGIDSTTLALRVADSPEGPWSAPRDILRPPESFEPDAFVYAGKAHPELHGGDLVATYVPSSNRETPLADEKRLYFAHFVKVTF